MLWDTTGRGKWGFNAPICVVSPCPIGRGQVASPTRYPCHLHLLLSWVQAAPVSQSSHWGRARLWLRVVRAEGFKRWPMMKTERAGRKRAESLADVCGVAFHAHPSLAFLGKAHIMETRFQFFLTGLWVWVWFFLLIYWILHRSSFLVKPRELSCRRLKIKHSHAKGYSLKCPDYSWFYLPDAFPDITVPSPVTSFCVRGPSLSMSCSASSSLTSCRTWRKRRVLRNRETCCQKRSLGQKKRIARLPELSLNWEEGRPPVS